MSAVVMLSSLQFYQAKSIFRKICVTETEITQKLLFNKALISGAGNNVTEGKEGKCN